MIEAHGLSRRYGDFLAVDDVSFAVDEGEIVGILGPNGAGKTTTIRMITGFLPPSTGEVTVAGRDLFREPGKARRDIGYLPENVALYPEMRVREYLAYRARLEGLGRGDARRAVDEAVERALLDEVREQIIGTLSKGYRQRVGLAAAILHRPGVLVLDEPTVGLDPKQIIAIRELIRELGSKRTLLLSTHILPEVELLCDRVLIFNRGRIVAAGTLAELSGRPTLRVGLRAAADAAPVLAGLPGVTAVDEVGRNGAVTYSLSVAEGADPREAVFRAAVAGGWVLTELAEERPSLEETFVRLTTRDTAPEAEEDAPTAAAPRQTDGEEAEPDAAASGTPESPDSADDRDEEAPR
jgi:ABC-2 type transport system ATP-binding protein